MDKEQAYILNLDECPSTAKSFVIDYDGKIVGNGKNSISQYFLKPCWLEQDLKFIWKKQLKSCKEAIEDARISPAQIKAIDVATQRETIVFWDKKNREPFHRAIIWQDKRTSEIEENIKREYEGWKKAVKKSLGWANDR